ncbi:MAG: hypothetical protein QM730_05685 [Anaerolineales bacterium]
MKKLGILALISTLGIFLLTNCSQQNTATEVTPTVYTRDEIDALMPDRVKESENTLSLSVKINSIEVAKKLNTDDSHVISLDITFRNISDHSIVFKKPRSTGFTSQGLGGFPVIFNDVGVVVQRKDGIPMNVFGTTQFIERLPASDMLSIFLFHLPEDFVTLESRETFSYTFVEELPSIFSQGDTSAKSLPAGNYILFVGYGNEAVGYQIPPVSAGTLTNPSSQIADLHAWVGTSIISSKVELTVPNQ